MASRITDAFSRARHLPAGFRRPSRLTFTVAAATVATAAITGTAAAGWAASPASAVASPAVTAATMQAAGAATAHSVRGVTPAVVTALSGQSPAHPGRAHPAAMGSHAKLTAQPRAHQQGPSRREAAAGRHAHGSRHHAAKRLTHPYRIYDSVTPSSIPAHQAAAVYSTGAYYARPSQVRHLGHTLWIDTTGRNYSASVLDVEPGDATPAQAASWAWHRLRANPHAIARIYTMRSQWGAVQSAVSHLPSWMRGNVRWWIADPTGVPHIVPGAQATQWYWGQSFDLTLAKPGF